jgi:hypothetical protein
MISSTPAKPPRSTSSIAFMLTTPRRAVFVEDRYLIGHRKIECRHESVDDLVHLGVRVVMKLRLDVHVQLPRGYHYALVNRDASPDLV